MENVVQQRFRIPEAFPPLQHSDRCRRTPPKYPVRRRAAHTMSVLLINTSTRKPRTLPELII